MNFDKINSMLVMMEMTDSSLDIKEARKVLTKKETVKLIEIIIKKDMEELLYK